VNSYLQQLIRAGDMMFDDEIFTDYIFNGTNLLGNAECQCHHPVRTNDVATTVENFP